MERDGHRRLARQIRKLREGHGRELVDRELLYDEAPQAYKDIAQVIADLEAARLVETIAVYRPVLTYKVRRARDE